MNALEDLERELAGLNLPPTKDVANWSEAESFDDMTILMSKFLVGKLDRTPWHGAPVDPETIPMLDSLRMLNVMGFMPVESQPGTCTYGGGIQQGPNAGKKYSEEQMGYIAGYIKKKEAASFIKELVKHDVFVIESDCSKRAKPIIHARLELKKTVASIANFWTRSKNCAINVTRDRIDGEEWRQYTNIPIADEGSCDLIKEFPFLKDTSYLVIVRMERCKNDLVDIVYDATTRIAFA